MPKKKQLISKLISGLQQDAFFLKKHVSDETFLSFIGSQYSILRICQHSGLEERFSHLTK